MASKAENQVVNLAGLVQGITLATFPAASSTFMNPTEYDLSNTRRRPSPAGDRVLSGRLRDRPLRRWPSRRHGTNLSTLYGWTAAAAALLSFAILERHLPRHG
jgi:hypothetical protein